MIPNNENKVHLYRGCTQIHHNNVSESSVAMPAKSHWQVFSGSDVPEAILLFHNGYAGVFQSWEIVMSNPENVGTAVVLLVEAKACGPVV